MEGKPDRICHWWLNLHFLFWWTYSYSLLEFPHYTAKHVMPLVVKATSWKILASPGPILAISSEMSLFNGILFTPMDPIQNGRCNLVPRKRHTISWHEDVGNYHWKKYLQSNQISLFSFSSESEMSEGGKSKTNPQQQWWVHCFCLS